MYVEVILPLNLNNSFTYQIANQNVQIGSFVSVNFRGKNIIGTIIKVFDKIDNVKYKIKEVNSLILINPVSENYIKFLKWVSDYNITTIGLILKSALINESPRYFKINKEIKNIKNKTYKKVVNLFKLQTILSIYDLIEERIRKTTLEKMLNENILVEVKEINKIENTQPKLQKISLSNEQKNISNSINLENFKVYLLDGITGSGKTSIYLNSIIDILNNNEKAQALIILPEISLSLYILNKIKSHFDDKSVVEWHSRLTPNKRSLNWHKMVSGQARVIVSARSAIFLPIPNLEIIVVDEEHDSSFKQDQNNFVYNARDLAIVRAKIFNIPIILSSATPSLESIHNTKNKNYIHLQLKNRFGGAQMPSISIVDMRNTEKINKYISHKLHDQIKENFKINQQSLIFLNRRGYSSLLLCSECGNRVKCYNCSSWLVHHKRKKILLCHLCGLEMQIPSNCENCNSKKLISFGPGVEKVEEEIKKLFPDKKICIISSDHQNAEDFKLIEENKIDIIIGTQIISKGYDFPNLSLLAVIDSDASIHGGDLRSTEKTFQILQQVIGRVGRRKELKGKVILQTYSPDSFMIQSLKNHDRDLFYERELNSRQDEFMPPFSRLAAIILSGYDAHEVIKLSINLQRNITNNTNLQIFGPAPAPIEVLNNKYRYRFLLVYKKTFKIQNYIQNWLSSVEISKKINIIIDIDPINFL